MTAILQTTSVNPENPTQSYTDYIRNYAPTTPEKIFAIISLGSRDNLQPGLTTAVRSKFAGQIYGDWQDSIDFALKPSSLEDEAARRAHVGELFGVWHQLFMGISGPNLPQVVDDLHKERAGYRYHMPNADMTMRLIAIMRGLRHPAEVEADSFTHYLSPEQLEQLDKMRHRHQEAVPAIQF